MSFVKYEPKGNIAYLIIDREKALNALNSQVLADLDATSASAPIPPSSASPRQALASRRALAAHSALPASSAPAWPSR